MKKFYLLFTFFIAMVVSVHAQEFKAFKVTLGLGYASASGNGASGGILAYAEPAYRLKDEIQLGLRFEGAWIVRGVSGNADNVSFDVAGISSTTVNGQYYFMSGGFRPFAGVGIGLFSLASVSIDTDGNNTNSSVAASSSKFGAYPRIGFDAGHFVLTIDYNILPNTETDTYTFKNSYLAIRAGVAIGGGRK